MPLRIGALIFSVLFAAAGAASCTVDTPPVWPERFKVLQRRIPDTDKDCSGGKCSNVTTFYDWLQGANLILDTADTVSPNGTMWDLELNDHRSFYIHPSVRTCKFIEMPVGILRPNWLEHATPMGESTVSGRRVFGWTKDDFIDYYADAEACTPVMWYFHGMKTSFYTLSFSEGEAAPEASYFKPPAYCPNATNRSNTAALIV